MMLQLLFSMVVTTGVAVLQAFPCRHRSPLTVGNPLLPSLLQ